MNKRTQQQINAQAKERKNERTSGRTDEWMNMRANEHTNELASERMKVIIEAKQAIKTNENNEPK